MQFNKKNVQLFFVNNLSWFLIIVFYLGFAILRPTGMLKLSTLSFMVYSTVPLGFIVIGVSLALLVAGPDLSLAQMTGFIGILSGMIITEWFPGIPGYIAIFIPVILGIVAGGINGLFIGYLDLNPFLVTLGGYMAYQGGTLLIRSNPIYKGFPELYLSFGRSSTISIIFFILTIVFIGAYVLRNTSFGLHIYGVGGNDQSAKMLGVDPAKIKFLTFSLGGAMAGLSAMFYTGFLNSVPPSMADGDIFLAFGGAIIGGIELEGGRGSMVNVLAGIIFLSLIEAGLSMFNVDPYLRRLSYGLLVILAIIINKTRNYFRDIILQNENEVCSSEQS